MKKILSFLLAVLLTGCAAAQHQATTGVQQTPDALPQTSVPPAAAQTTVTTFPSASVPQTTESGPTAVPTEAVTEPSEQATENIKAMWLSQFDLWDVYFDGTGQRPKGDFTQKADRVLENIAAMGFNTVFLQLRPNADSMYPSEYYPMSRYVVGQYGGEADYDPVAILVELARQKGLSVHGWINPMRGMKEEELTYLDPESILGSWAADPDKLGNFLVLHNGTWYLNPAYAEVRQLIVDGAAEAMTRYGLDGLHMDDYFYPTTDAAFDLAAFEALGGTDPAAFRRQNLNALVARLYETAHAAGGVFSISPAGNIRTVYEEQYADVYTWCANNGFVDYICPQIYYGLEHEYYDFVSVCETFSQIIQTDTVKLLVGMTFGKALTREDPYAGSGADEWARHQDVLLRCLQTTARLPHCRGVSVFCYSYFYDPLTGEPVEETGQEAENFLPAFGQMEWDG